MKQKQEANSDSTMVYDNNSKDEYGDDDWNELLASTMSRMSIEERSNGLHDLHGVNDLEEENPVMIARKTNEMDAALARRCPTTTLEGEEGEEGEEPVEPYSKALEMSSEYVQQLKLMFLRATSYDAQKAANRMLSFFRLKLDLFGDEKLTREITYDNLTKDEQSALQKGLIQLLPYRDRAGRAMVFIWGKPNNDDYSTKSIVSFSFLGTFYSSL